MTISDRLEKFNKEFEEARSQLKSFIFRVTASAADTEDILQDTYIRASEKLDTFKGESSLKTWFFSIASNLAKDHLRSRKRWPLNAMDLATCIGKTLPLEQQLVVLLKEIFEFKIKEIASIIDRTEGVVKHALFNARKTMEEIFEQRCSLINKNGACHQCSELNGLFNPKQVFQEQKLKTGLENDMENKTKDELFELRTRIAKAVNPYECNGADLHFFHFDHINNVLKSPSSE